MIKVVTDSVADLPSGVAKDLGITVIPMNVHFGSEIYKDRIELTADDFFEKLDSYPVLPTTSAPSPIVFANAFDELAGKCDGILGVFLSRNFSATCESALQGISLMKNKCQVEVIDSKMATMMEGLLVIEAAKKALEGASLSELVNIVSNTMPRIHMRSTLDTFKYLVKGGRVGKIQAWLGTMLKVCPINTIENGEAIPVARVRTRAKAAEWLYEYVTGFKAIRALAVEYGTNIAEAKTLAQRISAVFPDIPIYLSQVSPVFGTHTGPGVIVVSLVEE